MAPTAREPEFPTDCTAEVVGASGRMGTFFREAEPRAVACPRGTTPGSHTRPNAPIFVATPSDAYVSIYEATPPSRRRDLVLVGNAGLPIDPRLDECTIVVPHFSVLYTDQWKGEPTDPTSPGTSSDKEQQQQRQIQVNTDPLVSPPTYIYGRHAPTVATLLEAHGIATQIVPSFGEIRAYSGRKLLWASCFWLLCHATWTNSNSTNSSSTTASATALPQLPLTVGQVHEFRQDDLETLVDELLPSLRDWLLALEEDPEGGGGEEPEPAANSVPINDSALEPILDRTRVLEYLQAYSQSISGAVPSVDLAKQEFSDRNAVWLSHPQSTGVQLPKVLLDRQEQQPFHTELLRNQGVQLHAAAIQEDK